MLVATDDIVRSRAVAPVDRKSTQRRGYVDPLLSISSILRAPRIKRDSSESVHVSTKTCLPLVLRVASFEAIILNTIWRGERGVGGGGG